MDTVSQTLVLTKSDYMTGLRCPKLLWYTLRRPEEVPPPDEEALVRFAEGNETTKWARKRYPNGILVPQADREVVCKYTQELLSEGRPLFEAGFVFENLYVRCDILLPEGEGWHLIEVKASTELKDEHVDDLTFQRFVVESTGMNICRSSIMYLNKEYVRTGDIDLDKLFITVEVTANTAVVADRVQRLAVTLQGEEPSKSIGPYCKDPHPCALKDRCWAYLPQENITQLYYVGKKAFTALEQGCQCLVDADQHLKLTPKQQIQIQAHKSGTPHIDKIAITKFLGGLTYPLCFFDFETTASAIPRFSPSKPHQHIPFQYSLHLVQQDGTMTHHEFLASNDDDPRPSLIETLQKHLPPIGSIIVYYAAFERSKFQDMAEQFPQYQEYINALLPRIVDLYDIFSNFWYYSPKQHGSCSIKKVLPAICGNGYGDLEIQHGGMAMREFARITYSECDPADRERVRLALLTYCKQDTRAMVDLLNALHQL